MRSAKIVCTLGPASDSVEDIKSLAEAGMSVARLNASHGSPEHRRTMIDRIREVDQMVDSPVASMLDMPGPEVRTAPIEEPITLVEGSTVRFVVGDEATPDEVGLSQSISSATAGDRVLLDDGRIETTVESVSGDTIVAHVENGGELGARKGVNVPGVDLDLATITENDKRELDVAAEKEPDFVAASFVRDGEAIYEINEALEERGVDIPIIAKIERVGAVENLDSIIEAAYGIMVARGDLGVECPLEDVPIIQKRTIRKCHQAGVPVITATEMLDSMIHSRRPTRAEASDVANAVLDGTDAVMLSGETAIGDHPARVVETMDRIVRDVEGSEEYAESREQRIPDAGSAVQSALDTDAAEGGDTVVVLSGMMTELEGMNTANMLKVHVAAEMVVSGRSVVDGLATGPVYHVEDGDISDAPEGAVLVVPEGFDGEFSGDMDRINGIIDAHEGITSYAAIVARELSIPMVANAKLPDHIENDDILTLHAERGVVYEESVGREHLDER